MVNMWGLLPCTGDIRPHVDYLEDVDPPISQGLESSLLYMRL